MKKWTALSTGNEDKRWQALSAALTKAGAANEFVPWEGPVEFTDLPRFENLHHVRLSTRLSPQFLKHMKIQSSWTTLLGVIDGMVMKSGAWWPRCALYESYGQLILSLGADLDTRGSVLVAGSGTAARAAIAAFFKSGFRQFVMTGVNEEETIEAAQEIRTKFFGLNLVCVPLDKIVLLPGESSVLANCTPATGENKLMLELSYLNFLKRPGVLFDLNLSTTPSHLVQEALDADVKVIHGFEVASRSDVLWAKWAFNVELSQADYRQTLEQAFS